MKKNIVASILVVSCWLAPVYAMKRPVEGADVVQEAKRQRSTQEFNVGDAAPLPSLESKAYPQFGFVPVSSNVKRRRSNVMSSQESRSSYEVPLYRDLVAYRNMEIYRQLGLRRRKDSIITSSDIAIAYEKTKKAIAEDILLNNAEKFQRIVLLDKAYKILSDPEKKAAYDLSKKIASQRYLEKRSTLRSASDSVSPSSDVSRESAVQVIPASQTTINELQAPSLNTDSPEEIEAGYESDGTSFEEEASQALVQLSKNAKNSKNLNNQLQVTRQKLPSFEYYRKKSYHQRLGFYKNKPSSREEIAAAYAKKRALFEEEGASPELMNLLEKAYESLEAEYAE